MVYVIQVCWQLAANLYVLLCVQWKTADDGQRNCPKDVEFYSKNKFENVVHLVGFIIRMYINVLRTQTFTQGHRDSTNPVNTRWLWWHFAYRSNCARDLTEFFWQKKAKGLGQWLAVVPLCTALELSPDPSLCERGVLLSQGRSSLNNVRNKFHVIRVTLIRGTS